MADPFQISVENCFQGSPIPFILNFWTTPPDPNAVPPVAGTPKDISGWTFFFTWKKNYSDPDSAALYKKDWTVTTGTNGSTTFTIPSASTINVPAKVITFWDVKTIQTVGTDPATTLNGTIYLNPAITQRLIPS